MTSSTPGAKRSMGRMIECDVKTSQRRKRLNLSACWISVTDRADLAALVCKLLRVTTGARRMRRFARQGWLR
jgi:hypothetical protein